MEILGNNVELVNTLAATISGACGQIPPAVFNVVSMIIMLIQVVVPILLIIWGMIDFAKSVIGGDEDKIKAGQKVFIKRLIAAVLVFLVVTIAKLLVGLVGQLGAEGASGDIWNDCISKFVTGA